MGGSVVVVETTQEWNSAHAKAKADRKIIVVDFFADWCGPCRRIAPYFEKLSLEYGNAVFLKVNTDKAEDVARDCGIRALPTFQVWKDNETLDEITGAEENKLRALVERHYGKSASSAFSGQGQRLGSSSSVAAEAPSSAPSSAPAPAWSGVDESQPTTSIQIRLQDGSRLIGKFNHKQTVADVRAFVLASKPSLPANFQLMTQFPSKTLSNVDESIADAGLLNAAIIVKT